MFKKNAFCIKTEIKPVFCLFFRTYSVSYDYMFLCGKYGVRLTSARDSETDALSYVFVASLGACL